MKTNRIFSLFCVVLMTLTLSTAWAGYPEKPIELVVPFGAGGSTDLAARVLSSVIPAFLGQPVVVINKKGGGGLVGMNYVAKARPDGYTIMEATIGPLTIYPALHEKSPFSYKNFKPIARTEIVPAVLRLIPPVSSSTPAPSVRRSPWRVMLPPPLAVTEIVSGTEVP